jgi:general stress protein YciG
MESHAIAEPRPAGAGIAARASLIALQNRHTGPNRHVSFARSARRSPRKRRAPILLGPSAMSDTTSQVEDHAEDQNKPRPRGFAALPPEVRRALGSKGGKIAHERGTANRFDSESGSEAGRIPHLRGTAYKWTSESAAAAGRKGAGVPRRRAQ